METDIHRLTSDDEVCIGEEAFSLHECSGVTRVENIKDAICIHPHRPLSWTDERYIYLSVQSESEMLLVCSDVLDVWSQDRGNVPIIKKQNV